MLSPEDTLPVALYSAFGYPLGLWPRPSLRSAATLLSQEQAFPSPPHHCLVSVRATSGQPYSLLKRPIRASLRPFARYISTLRSQSCATRLVLVRSVRLAAPNSPAHGISGGVRRGGVHLVGLSRSRARSSPCLSRRLPPRFASRYFLAEYRFVVSLAPRGESTEPSPVDSLRSTLAKPPRSSRGFLYLHTKPIRTAAVLQRRRSQAALYCSCPQEQKGVRESNQIDQPIRLSIRRAESCALRPLGRIAYGLYHAATESCGGTYFSYTTNPR